MAVWGHYEPNFVQHQEGDCQKLRKIMLCPLCVSIWNTNDHHQNVSLEFDLVSTRAVIRIQHKKIQQIIVSVQWPTSVNTWLTAGYHLSNMLIVDLASILCVGLCNMYFSCYFHQYNCATVSTFCSKKNPCGRFKVAICSYQSNSHLYGYFTNIWSGDLQPQEKSVTMHDTKCPYWDQVPLNNTKGNPRYIEWSVHTYPLVKNVVYFHGFP